MPPRAAELFGPQQLPAAECYARLLCTDGVVRGVIGPREPMRIWSRHLLNSAVVTELFPSDCRVVDVGSGAGLPGIAVALRRPDLRVDLVEPLQRRIGFLADVVAQLGLGDRVRVVRGRAEDAAVRAAVGSAAWVTARAVAPLDRLVRWCLPLLAPRGRLALLKGASAADELDRHRSAITQAGGRRPRIVQCGAGVVEPPVAVVVVDGSERSGSGKGKR